MSSTTICIILGVYFLPTIIAILRLHPFPHYIFLINLMYSWTGLGWIRCMYYSLMSRKMLREEIEPGMKALLAKSKEETNKASLNKPDYERDRQLSVQWAKGLLTKPGDWVILDTETTGIQDTCEVIQIAVVDSSGRVLLDTLVKPVRAKRMPARALKTHGITMERLKNAPTFTEVRPTLEKIIRNKTVIAYNAKYDKRLIWQTTEFNAEKPIEAVWDCAMEQYSRYVGVWWHSKQDYKWQKLPGTSHNAVEDCLAVIKIIKVMAEFKI